MLFDLADILVNSVLLSLWQSRYTLDKSYDFDDFIQSLLKFFHESNDIFKFLPRRGIINFVLQFIIYFDSILNFIIQIIFHLTYSTS